MQTELERNRFERDLGSKCAELAEDLNIRCEEEGMSNINIRFLFWRIGLMVV